MKNVPIAAKPIPPSTFRKLRSCSVRTFVISPVAAFFTSLIDRVRPPIRLLRMRNNVNAALINMPPTAIGRTMFFQTCSDKAIQPSASVGLASPSNVGAMKYVRIGTKNPQASRPPEKFSEASFGPMM